MIKIADFLRTICFKLKLSTIIMHNDYNYSSAVNDAQAHLIIVSFLVPKLRVILSISYELLLGP